MHVFLVEDRDAFPGIAPALALSQDSWDDFSYKTTFWLTLWLGEHDRLDLPQVKIMRSGMTAGRTPIPPVSVDGLPNEFASIGAEYAFYEEIAALGTELGTDVAKSLNDLALHPDVHERFSQEDAYKTSLLRLSPARDALRKVRSRIEAGKRSRSSDVTAMVQDTIEDMQRPAPDFSDNVEPEAAASLPLVLAFEPPAMDAHRFEPSSVTFDFSAPRGLPGNLIALTGPNGTGKTTLLSRLALARFFDGERDGHGTVNIQEGDVSKVIFVSFSAYDSFEIPSTQIFEGDVQHTLTSKGYVYIGLRKLDAASTDQDPLDRQYRLKSIREIDKEFDGLLRAFLVAGMETKKPSSRLPTRRREDELRKRESFVGAVSTLFEDPSMSAISALPPPDRADDVINAIAALFPRMSTGHKAILNIVASLCAHLDTNSLVLLDEPETHLHPPLVASLLTTVRKLLADFSSNAIVATHSPVVVQETLGQHVLKFTRNGATTRWKPSDTQTFGDNVASLTRGTFGLPAARADYIGVLRELVYAGNGTLEEVEALFAPRMLSSPARAQVLRLIAERRGLTP